MSVALLVFIRDLITMYLIKQMNAALHVLILVCCFMRTATTISLSLSLFVLFFPFRKNSIGSRDRKVNASFPLRHQRHVGSITNTLKVTAFFSLSH